jgi:hypothetical protein
MHSSVGGCPRCGTKPRGTSESRAGNEDFREQVMAVSAGCFQRRLRRLATRGWMGQEEGFPSHERGAQPHPLAPETGLFMRPGRGRRSPDRRVPKGQRPARADLGGVLCVVVYPFRARIKAFADCGRLLRRVLREKRSTISPLRWPRRYGGLLSRGSGRSRPPRGGQPRVERWPLATGGTLLAGSGAGRRRLSGNGTSRVSRGDAAPSSGGSP